jgi:hypothetical protein
MTQRLRAICIFSLCLGTFAAAFFFWTQTVRHSRLEMIATPWACVGGCGAGGSGGAGGASVKWIGNGVQGGLIDVQEVLSSTATKKSVVKSLESRISFHPTYTSVLALTIPVLSKNGDMLTEETATSSDETPGIINNGLGDIRIDFQNAFGLSGEFTYNFTLAIPTGIYDEGIGPSNLNLKKYLPQNLQLGSGLYSLTLDLGYTKDFDKALLLVDAMYSHPFAVNFSGKNTHYPIYDDTATWNLMTADQKRRFKYYFKPYGENDLGAYTPPSVSVSAFYAYKGMEHFVHSVGCMFSAPLGVAWIPGFSEDTYNPKPDPDNQAWNATLCYGLEFSRTNFPIFIAAYVPIHSKTASATNAQVGDEFNTNIMAKWNAPDWHDVLHRWSIFVGTKTTLF